jgi:hypothetical protein
MCQSEIPQFTWTLTSTDDAAVTDRQIYIPHLKADELYWRQTDYNQIWFHLFRDYYVAFTDGSPLT